MANQETVSTALSTMASTDTGTHLPQGNIATGAAGILANVAPVDLDLDSRTQPWEGAHPAGGYFETGQPLKPEKVPSRQGGGVPAHAIRFRLNLPEVEQASDVPTADAPRVAKMRVRKFCGQWVVAGHRRHHACGSWGEAFAVALFVFENGYLPVEAEDYA